jgi:hypothetical protein
MVVSSTHHNNYIDSLTFYKTIQIPLKNIIRKPLGRNDINRNLDSFNLHAVMISRIMYHVSLFFKLYILYSFDNNEQFPVINRKLFLDIARVICDKDNVPVNKRDPNNIYLQRPAISNPIQRFFHNHYSHTMLNEDFHSLDFNLMTQSIQYEADTLITALETHISEHFRDMFFTYCNLECYLDQHMQNFDRIRNTELREARKREFRKGVRLLKNDILNNTDTCEEDYIELKEEIIRDIFGGRDRIKTLKDDIHKRPLTLLKPLIGMSQKGEEIMRQRYHHLPEKERPLFKIINVFPLKKSIIPGYTPIDTLILVNMFFGPEKAKPYLEINQGTDENGKHISKKITNTGLRGKGNLLKYNHEIWNSIFNMDHKVFKFKKGEYTFNRRIMTDGFGCSILFLRNDKYKTDKKSSVRPVKKPYGYKEDQYIDDLPRPILDKMNKDLIDGKIKLAANDPGHNDIAYMTDGVTEIIEKANGKKCRKTNTLRFTQIQRRRETKTKINSRRMETDKKKTIISNQSVKKIESKLSQFNANTCFFRNFYDFVVVKNEVSYTLLDYYSKNLYRYLTWCGKVNKRKSDDKFVSRFREKFGPPDKVILLYGDQDQHNMRYKEPVKGRSMRRLFKKHGYRVYLVDEFRTTMMLYGAPGIDGNGVELENFCKMKNKKPKRESKPHYDAYGEKVENPSRWREIVESHELLRSKTYTNVQLIDGKTNLIDLAKLAKGELREWVKKVRYTHTIVNRNANASLNILFKGRCVIEGRELPKRLRRGEFGA